VTILFAIKWLSPIIPRAGCSRLAREVNNFSGEAKSKRN
jgi:hypothetical protein